MIGLIKTRRSSRRLTSIALRYGLSAVSVGAALIVTRLLGDLMKPTPVLLLFAAVLISAWHGGIGPGLVAALLSFFAIDYFLIDPYSLSGSLADILRLLVFVLSALLVGWLSTSRRRAEDSLKQARDELENRVNQRTEELTKANEALKAEIAERERVEQSLKQSEERYRELFENANDIVYTLDLEGNLTSLNKAGERLTGYAREEMLGKSIAPIVAPGYMDRMREMMARKLAGENITTYELEVIRKDGRRLMLEVSSRLICEQGRPAGVQGIARDITERKRAEEALRRSEDRYRTLADAVQQLLWINDAEGRNIYVNSRWEAYTGLKVGGSLNMEWLELVHPDDVHHTLEVRDVGIQSGQAYEYEFRFMRADGMYRWHIARVVPLKDDDGRALQWIGTATDIHVIKKTEKEQRFLAEAGPLLASSLEEETTLRSLAEMVVPHLADWCIVDLIKEEGSVHRIKGRHADPSKEGLLTELLMHYPHSYKPDDNYSVPKVMRTGEPEVINLIDEQWLESATYSGEQKRYLRELSLGSCMIVPLVMRGRIIGAISFASAEVNRYSAADLRLAQDLARRAALAIDNARLYREAQEASRLKDEFLATVSHELRTPLNAILGWAEMLRAGKVDVSLRERAFETIVRNAKSQAQLIEDILDVSRIITGKMRLDVHPTGLIFLISAAIDAVRPAAYAKGIQLESSLDPSVGSVTGDPNRLQQVVWNLLTNAIKFTPAGGRVEVRLERRGRDARIVVSDNGAGIKGEFLPHVFDRFRQADSSYTRRHGGLGLGLAIVRHLVEMHGGTVHAESEGENCGATFAVSLPLTQLRIEDCGFGIEGDVKLDGQDRKSAFRIPQSAILNGVWALVVDDEPDALELIKMTLERFGAKVSAARSVAEAVDALKQCEASSRPDVILSDIGMPNEDGIVLMSKVQAMEIELGGKIPAIALTAYAREEDRARALMAGYEMHIAKPFSPDDVATAVASIIGRAEKSLGG